MKPLISLEDVCYSYDTQEVLSEVNFTLYEGEFLAIIGPNGGGKTTLLKLLMGLYTPSKGTMKWHRDSFKDFQKEVGYVPQRALFDREFPISLLEFLLTGALLSLNFLGRFSKEKKQKAFDLLHELGLCGFKDAPLGSLSGGQLQRALIARALMQDPTILFLDEPTTNIDRENWETIKTFLSHYKKGRTIVLITHELPGMIVEVDRVLCAQQKVSISSPEEVCEHVQFGLYHSPQEKSKVEPLS